MAEMGVSILGYIKAQKTPIEGYLIKSFFGAVEEGRRRALSN